MNINITLLGQMITFGLLIWFTMKFVWPPIMSVMAERQKTIADGLAQAERGKRDLDLAQKKASDLLRVAREDAADLMVEAGKRAGNLIEEAKSHARTEGERLVSAARAEIDLEVSRAREHLRRAVAELAIAGAGKVLEKEIDAKVHGKLLDDMIKKL